MTARTTSPTPPQNGVTDRPKSPRKVRCGFCLAGDHEHCVRAMRNLEAKPIKVWPCACTSCGGGSQGLVCLDCRERSAAVSVSPETWSCRDTDACQARIEAKRPPTDITNWIGEREMAKAATTIPKAKTATARPEKAKTFCLVTGEETKGGLFKPGMDARYVSTLVKDVMAKTMTVAQARSKMKSDGVSPTLQGKFEKALGLARERAAAEKAAKAEKAANAGAKAAPAKKSATPRRKPEVVTPAPEEPEYEDDADTEDNDEF